LERFLRKCAKHEFIINSDEFLMFSRPNGDIEKMLTRLPRIPTSSMIERLHKATNIDERKYDLSDREKFKSIIIEFSYFVKKALP
jgi:hypothetical protein